MQTYRTKSILIAIMLTFYVCPIAIVAAARLANEPGSVAEIQPIRPVIDSADTELLRLKNSLNLAADITVAPGGNVQAAINTALPGDSIILQADGGYVCAGGCVLPVKTGIEYVTIKSSRYGEIPVRTFFSTIPTPEVAKLMARVSPSFSTEPAFRAAPGAHHYKLLGLNVTAPTGQATRLIELGVSGAAQDTIEEMPHHFVIDKSWIHGATTQEVQRCIALNSSDNEITNNWITDCHGRGYDAQAIASWNGGSNTRIINNSLSGSGENYMAGGSPASIPNLVPTNIEFRRNYVWKPLTWYVNDPSFAGIKWSVKNLFELKNARNVTIDGNVFENNWTDAQAGRAIVFTPRPSDSGVWAVIEDVQFTNNIVRNAGSGMLILGADEAPAPTENRLRRLRVANNLFHNIDGGRFGSNGFFLTVINKTENVTVEHNTVFQTGNIVGSDYAPNSGFIYRDNISRHNQYGIFGGGIGNTAIAQYFPGAIVTGNVMAKEVNSPSNAETLYPAGNFFPVNLAAVGFVDLANGNYRLAASSPYKGKGSNATDPGADMNALEAAIGGATPTPTPTPTPTVSPTPLPSPSPTPTAQPTPTPSPTPTATPTPQPTPSVTPTPLPSPPPTCSFTVPNTISIPRWGSRVVTAELLRQPGAAGNVSATPLSGQVSVIPRTPRAVSGTSSLIDFQVSVKNNASSVRFDSPCGSRTMQVIVTR